MQIRIEQLAAHLQRGPLARLYTVSSDEALLGLEAQDAIRVAARRNGYAEREILHADHRFDWSQLVRAASGLSLFAPRRMLEIRLPGGKPGKNGAQALRDHAHRKGDDLLSIVSLPRLDRATRTTEWAETLQTEGVWIEIPRMERAQLPEWIAGRLARQNQSAEPGTLEWMADRLEGNLLAAHQEIGKLGLLYETGPLHFEQVRTAVFDVARFDPSALPATMLGGDPARIRRLLAGLEAEGEPLPLLLWIVSEELRSLLRRKPGAEARPAYGAARAGSRSWTPRPGAPAAMVDRVLPRIGERTLAELLSRCAEVDRIVKGLRVAERGDDPWLELTDIALTLHGAAHPD